jgi:hypothetical protein
MRRAYQASLNVRFAVEADSQAKADDLAAAFAENLAAWMDGRLGSPPFAPWLTAWYEESLLQPLNFTQEQLANWNPLLSDALEPFDS